MPPALTCPMNSAYSLLGKAFFFYHSQLGTYQIARQSQVLEEPKGV